MIVNSLANSDGVVAWSDEMKALANSCKERACCSVPDEAPRAFLLMTDPFATPAT